jgi:hypothetical protein
MDVAHDALAGRNRVAGGELMLDGVARLVLRDHRILAERSAAIAVDGIRPGMNERAIVRIDDVAGAAPARAIVARMIVRAEEIERRIEGRVLARLMKTGSVRFSVPRPRLLKRVRAAVHFFTLRDADFGRSAAPLEDAQHVAGCVISNRGSGSR